jgi:GNAT superfamily N-acetyltransferase
MMVKRKETKRVSLDLEFHPLTSERWNDLEKLFGKHGASGGCWCMWWRLRRSEFVKQKGEGNKKALKQIVESGEIPGILAYTNGQPIGWCSVAPRESYSALERSRVLKRVDDKPVWSIVCFFVDKQFRRKGVTVALLKAAVEYVREHGGKILEGYPVEPKEGKTPDVFVYTGLASAFRKIGFVEVARRSETRPIMRYLIGEK